ncbi:DNA cytosine methyltransferase, partial [Pseudomonas sp. MWU12-2312b]
IKIGVELEGEYIDSSLLNNPELWRDDSIVINADVRDVNMLGSGIPQAQVLIGGIPCTGASRAGAAKNGLNFAEEHESAGSLFFNYLEWVKATNPCIVVLE